MRARIEELAWAATPMGEIVLRRRIEPSLGVEVYEVRLGEEYLMTSLFTASEVALATLGLAMLPPGPDRSTSWSAGWGWGGRPAPCSTTSGSGRCSWSTRWTR